MDTEEDTESNIVLKVVKSVTVTEDKNSLSEIFDEFAKIHVSRRDIFVKPAELHKYLDVLKHKSSLKVIFLVPGHGKENEKVLLGKWMPSKYNATIASPEDILNPENPDLSFETIDIAEALNVETVYKSPDHGQSATVRKKGLVV